MLGILRHPDPVLHKVAASRHKPAHVFNQSSTIVTVLHKRVLSQVDAARRRPDHRRVQLHVLDPNTVVCAFTMNGTQQLFETRPTESPTIAREIHHVV